MAVPLVNSQIGLANPTSIVSEITTFGSKPVREWLPLGHPARSCQIVDPATHKGIRRLDQARQNLTDAQMISLVAACGPNHCLDGWSYLSRSVSALVARDGHSAKHMAYYAQLRAANEYACCFPEWGFFNGLNICVDANGAVHQT